MKRTPFPVLTLLLAAALACSFEYIPPPAATPTLEFVFASAPAEEEPLVVPTLTRAPPTTTFTPAPATQVPTITQTATFIIPLVAPLDDGVFCRIGPSLDWAVDAVLPRNTWVPVHGRDPTGEWLYIAKPGYADLYCYVARAVVQTIGSLEDLPLAPTPVAWVTDLSVKVFKMDSQTPLPYCFDLPLKPYEFEVKISITVNGPTTLEYIGSMDNGNAHDPQVVEIKSAGTYVFHDTYPASTAGSKWYLLEVTEPFEYSAKGTVTLNCNKATATP